MMCIFRKVSFNFLLLRYPNSLVLCSLQINDVIAKKDIALLKVESRTVFQGCTIYVERVTGDHRMARV